MATPPHRTQARFRLALVAAAFVAPLLAGAVAAPAGASAGRNYGQHVVECAQSVGLNGTHNPGMHHGYAGWDGEPCAP